MARGEAGVSDNTLSRDTIEGMLIPLYLRGATLVRAAAEHSGAVLVNS
jgi:hypothetical protein